MAGHDESRSDEASPDGLDDSIRLLAHQLKSPVNAIRSLLDGISQGLAGEISPQAALLVQRAARRADEARNLIADLLDYQALTRPEAIHREEIDAAALASQVVAEFQRPATDGGIALDAAIPEGVEAWVRGNRRSLEQALSNLVENAVKYTPPDGKVTVAVDPTAAPESLAIRVSDTGPGILPEDLPHLFEPFFRSSRHRATVAGTGLGLALARRILQAHGGTLGVEPGFGGGSVFTMSLPLVRIGTSRSPARKRRRVVIIGGVTAGPKTAARLRRLDAEADITMIEKSEFLSYTGCSLPAYVSGRVESPRALMSTADNALRTARFFQTVKDVRVLNRTLATEIDRAACTVHCRDLASGRGFEVPYDTLVLATGARPYVPAVPGIGLDGIYTLYSLDAARDLRSHLKSRGSQDAFVIGAGYIGVSTAESLVEAGARVTLLEREPVILGQYFDTDLARRVQEELARRGVKVVTSAAVKRIEKTGDQLRIETDDRFHLADLIILATGVTPNADLAERAGLDIGISGGVHVNSRLQTSDPRIWAVGDCAETISLPSGRSEFLPLGSVSTKMGRIAADCIAGRDVHFRGSVGTTMFRIFDINTARCGLTNARALERGFDAVSVGVTGLDRPHNERGAAHLHVKVTADRRTGMLLGAQGMGAGNVVPRIQILAAAISRGLTLGEVFDLDLGYNPAFTTAIDISQTACLLLQSKMEGLVRTITFDELAAAAPPPSIVDVSPYAEYALRSMQGSLNVPLEHLRREGIPFRTDEAVVLCDTMSVGAYEAYHILSARGWKNLAILEGGTEGRVASAEGRGPLP